MIFKILANYGPLLLAAMGQTLLLALWSLFFACLIGLFVGILSVLKSRVCNIIATIFVDIIRGVPMIVLAFFVYFGVPMLMNDNLNWTAMTGSKFTFTALQAGIICLSLNCGAYMPRSSAPVSRAWTKARWRPPAALACRTGRRCTGSCCRRPSAQ